MTDPYWQAEALSQLAGAYVQAGQPAKAGQLIAQALVAGELTKTMLAVLSDIAPEVVTTLNECLLG